MDASNRLSADSQKRLKKSHISAAVLLSTLLVLSGCSGKGKSDDDKASTATSFTTTTFITTTVPESTTTTTQVIYPEEYRVPDVIDAAYVERVMNRLYEAQTEMDRMLVAGEPFGEKHKDILKNIYVDTGKEKISENAYLSAVGDYVEKIDSSELKENFTSLKTKVVKINESTSSCIWFEKTVDNSGYLKEPFPSPVIATVLVRRDKHDLNINPTPWKVYLSTMPSIVEGKNPCG